MKNSKFHVNNAFKFIFFTIIVLIIISLFVFFILKYNKMDDNRYPITIGSVFYNEDYNYLKTESESYFAQRFDGNYYWYQKENSKTKKEKIGANPVVYNKTDYKVYLFGNAYQVLSTGEIKSLSGLTEIAKASPTKFYKLKDRKYLMVDSSLKTNDKSIKTSGYLLIELDKKGNATFANNELNIKTLKPLVLKGTTMNFDVANEKLIYGKKEINLKNIIGSTNDYKEEPKENEFENKNPKTDSSSNSSTSSSSSITSENSGEYYDEYVRDVIYSVNNLTNSVTEVNDKTDTSVKKGEIYYDFSKYIALKSVTSSVTSINVNYTVVDSNNEYQSVFIIVDDNMGKSNKYYLNKNDINYTVRNLEVDHNYTVSFGYKLVVDSEEVVEDVVNVKTKSPTCSVNVQKVSMGTITYLIKIGAEYKFDSGEIYLYSDDVAIASQPVDMSSAASNSGYVGTLHYDRLGNINALKIENIVYNGNNVAIDCSYRFAN